LCTVREGNSRDGYVSHHDGIALVQEDMSGTLVEVVQRTVDCACRNVAEWGDVKGEDMFGGPVEAVQRTVDCAFRNVADSEDEQGEDNVAVPAQEEEYIHWRLTRPSFLSNCNRTHSPLCGVLRDE